LKITDEYVHRPATPKPLYVRASEKFGKLDIDPRKIEKTPHHHRPPWIDTNIKLCSIERGDSNVRFRQESARILENNYNTISRSARMVLRRKIESDTQYSGIHKKTTKEYGHKTRSTAPNNQPL
jgi:hypothetical protein